MTTFSKGIHFQLYREATGYQTHRAAFLRDARALGGVGIIEHGSISRKQPLTETGYRKLRDETRKAGYQSGVATGPGDFGTVANATAMGRAFGRIARHADYAVTDLEGQHEDQAGDVDRALAYYAGLRETAPDVLLIDQPPARPIPRKHSSPLWRLAAKYVDLRAPMLYFNNLRGEGEGKLGDDAYVRIWPDYLKDWNEWVPKNTPAPVVADPWIPSLQAYHYVDWTLVDVLENNPTCIMWCENHSCESDGEKSVGPYPTEQTRVGLRVVQKLKALGFTGPKAVEAFQRSPAGKAAKLRADNQCSKLTRAALGIV